MVFNVSIYSITIVNQKQTFSQSFFMSHSCTLNWQFFLKVSLKRNIIAFTFRYQVV